MLWLDADVDFEDENWPEIVLQAFEKYDIIQPYDVAKFLGP